MKNLAARIASLSPTARLELARRIGAYTAAGKPPPSRAVIRAAVRVRADREGNQGGKDFESFLRGHLPQAMQPAQIEVMAGFPLLPNGKTDRAGVAAALVALQSSPNAQEDPAASNPASPKQQALQEIWQIVLQRPAVGLHDDFFALGGDSLAAMRVLTLARQRSLEFSLADLFARPTIAELLGPESRPIPPARATVSSTVEVAVPAPDEPEIVRYPHAEGVSATVVIVHGIEGYGLLAGRLASRFPDTIELIGIESPREPRETVEETARRYLDEIEGLIAPDRPIFLAGYCFGGAVVYEMARQRASLGRPVTGLMIIDTAVPRLIRPTVKRVFEVEGWGGLRRRVWARLRPAGTPMEATKPTSDLIQTAVPGGDPDYFAMIAEDRWSITRAHIRSILAYQPQEYTAPVLLLRTPTDDPLMPPDFGWGKCMRGELRIHLIESTHSGLIKAPTVDAVAGHLMDEIARLLGKSVG